MHFQWECWKISQALSLNRLQLVIVQMSLGGRQSPNVKRGYKGAWPGSRDPLNFWALNAKSSKITKGTNFRFGVHASWESPDMPLKNFFRKGVWPGSRDPLIFWVLNANSSKMTKVVSFKFGMLAPRESPDMTPEKFFEKGAWPGSLDPLFFGR